MTKIKCDNSNKTVEITSPNGERTRLVYVDNDGFIPELLDDGRVCFCRKYPPKCIHCRFHDGDELSKAERKFFSAGDYRKNMATCLLCYQTIRSVYSHDFKTCSCGNLSVDGGSWYLRRIVREPGTVMERSIKHKDWHFRCSSRKETTDVLKQNEEKILSMSKDGYGAGKIAEEIGTATQPVYNLLKKKGLSTKDSDGKKRFNPRWGDATRVVKGYIEIMLPWHPLAKQSTGYVGFHRLIYSLWHPEWDFKGVIHHVDGDITNNSPSNLELFADNGIHRKEHCTEQKRDKFGRFK